jgi:hypothetical protein
MLRKVFENALRDTRRDIFLRKKKIPTILGVATQFLTNVLINFQKNPKIEKNNENPKKYVFDIFSLF